MSPASAPGPALAAFAGNLADYNFIFSQTNTKTPAFG